ncbi:MAG: hypothetical protein ACLPVF_06765 [Acidimicrobiales bacterium]
MINVHFVYVGVALGVLGSAGYLRDTLRGTTHPNRVTWLLWAVAPLLATAVELRSGVGLRTLTTFTFGFMPLLIFIASFHNPSAVWRIRRLDYVCGALSVAGTAAWLLTRSGTFAIAAAIAADFLAAVPTVVKSWTNPETESVSAYAGALANATIVLLTLTQWTVAEAAFPLYIVCIAGVEVLLVGAAPGPRHRRAVSRRSVPVDRETSATE